LDIARLIEKACDDFTAQNTASPDLETILAADSWARQRVLALASTAQEKLFV
jgi:1-deoxy-D-xylulose-5-phosphate reductoisomerase